MDIKCVVCCCQIVAALTFNYAVFKGQPVLVFNSQDALAFYVSFDGSAEANLGNDRKVYTAETLARKTMQAGLP